MPSANANEDQKKNYMFPRNINNLMTLRTYWYI